MAEGRPEIRPTELESKKIDKLVEKNKEELGEFDIVPVDEAGFLLQRKELKPMAGNDWVFLDYDDTLAATTEIKQDRLSLYKEYLNQEPGLTVSEENVQRVMDITDNFSRWEEKPGEGKHYHVGAHMSALTWATEQLKSHPQKNLDHLIERVKQAFERIKAQLKENGGQESEDPFYFRGKKLILRTKRPWSRKVEEIFEQTMFNPPLYEETVDATKETGEPTRSIHRFNVGVFTYGEPQYQLSKVFNLLKSHPDLPISQIWLTRKPKGEFVEELIKTKAVQETELDYVPTELEDYPGESLSPPSGYPLGETPHTMVIFDDDPKQLSNVLSSNEFLRENSGAKFLAVRSRQESTKAENREWNVKAPYNEVDFTSREYLSRDIANIFRINRYLAMRENYSEDHPRLVAEKEHLKKLGVNIRELK